MMARDYPLDSLKSPKSNIDELAELYGSFIEEHRRRDAAYDYLRPLGLDVDIFGSGAAGLPANLVEMLADKMISHRIECEAIVAGCGDDGSRIFHVDDRGFVTCHDDAGFVSIGSGSPHADATFMSVSYNSWSSFVRAALTIFVAKKRAEIAPGVGHATDIHIVTRTGIVRLAPPIENKINELSQRESSAMNNRYNATADELQAFLEAERQRLQIPADLPEKALGNEPEST